MKRKKISNKKLVLRKETIAKLNAKGMGRILAAGGGASAHDHSYCCTWHTYCEVNSQCSIRYCTLEHICVE